MGILFAVIGCVSLGISLEVFWTSLDNYFKTKDVRLIGKSYLWMFLIYALVPFIYLFVLHFFGNNSIFIRAIIYMFAFFVLEYCTGLIIKLIVGKSPWNYSGYTINFFGKHIKSEINGLVCLQYAPIWYLYGLFFEYCFKILINI